MDQRRAALVGFSKGPGGAASHHAATVVTHGDSVHHDIRDLHSGDHGRRTMPGESSVLGEGRRPSSGARLGVDGGEGWPPAPTPMLVKVTVTVAVWADTAAQTFLNTAPARVPPSTLTSRLSGLQRNLH